MKENVLLFETANRAVLVNDDGEGLKINKPTSVRCCAIIFSSFTLFPSEKSLEYDFFFVTFTFFEPFHPFSAL